MKRVCGEDTKLKLFNKMMTPLDEDGINFSKDSYRIRLVIAGESGVGKSCFLKRLCEGVYEEGYGLNQPTIGVDFRIYSYQTRTGKNVNCRVWDTAGEERFHAISSAYFRGSGIVVFCYDMTDIRTLDALYRTWLPIFEREYNSLPEGQSTYTSSSSITPVICVVGTKKDLPRHPNTFHQVHSLLDKFRDLGYSVHHFETSAKDDFNVKMVVHFAIDLADTLSILKKDDPSKLISLTTSPSASPSCCTQS